jgi:hypothetical protein
LSVQKRYDDWVVIEVDARNMFHKIDREKLIRRVAEEAPLMLNSVLKLLSHQHLHVQRNILHGMHNGHDHRVRELLNTSVDDDGCVCRAATADSSTARYAGGGESVH